MILNETSLLFRVGEAGKDVVLAVVAHVEDGDGTVEDPKLMELGQALWIGWSDLPVSTSEFLNDEFCTETVIESTGVLFFVGDRDVSQSFSTAASNNSAMWNIYAFVADERYVLYKICSECWLKWIVVGPSWLCE